MKLSNGSRFAPFFKKLALFYRAKPGLAVGIEGVHKSLVFSFEEGLGHEIENVASAADSFYQLQSGYLPDGQRWIVVGKHCRDTRIVGIHVVCLEIAQLPSQIELLHNPLNAHSNILASV